jgi:hypothetical protein
MGMWNGTCGVSGLPIVAGTVKLIFLAWHPPTFQRESRLVDVADLASPLALPIRGTYDRYGKIVDIDGGMIPAAIGKAFRRRFEEKTLAIEGATAFPAGMEAFVEAVQDTRVTTQVVRRFGPTVKTFDAPMTFMFVLDDVYDWLVDQVDESDDVDIGYQVDDPLAKLRTFHPNVVLGGDDSIWRKEAGRFAQFLHGMQVLRRVLSPPAAAGHQETGFALHKGLAKMITKLDGDRFNG